MARTEKGAFTAVATYTQPEMNAAGVHDAALTSLQAQQRTNIINFANPDMVGHTGTLTPLSLLRPSTAVLDSWLRQ